MSSIFLSHNHADKPFVRRLAKDLQDAGVRVWLDEAEMMVGDSLIERIRQGIDEMEYLGVILSQNSVRSEWVKREVDIAMNQEIEGKRVKVLPLVIENCELPGFLKGKLYADFRNRRKYKNELDKVIHRLGKTSPRKRTTTDQPFEPEMILIPAGEFLMGSDPKKDAETSGLEQPQHILYLSDYYLAKTPVTNAQYAAFIQATNHDQPKYWNERKPPRGKENHPVLYTSWYDAMAYCRWLSEFTGKSYLLPSEAQWEKGARGPDGRIYPWGDQWDASRCNYWEYFSEEYCITPVDAYPKGASPYGLLDMVGNIREWTLSIIGWRSDNDILGDGLHFGYPYNPHDGREYVDAPRVMFRVTRGGFLFGELWSVRCACRLYREADYVSDDIGFRVAMNPQ
jgi:formylglycine-generating enzyme required for sulfatase activity